LAVHDDRREDPLCLHHAVAWEREEPVIPLDLTP
jgi:hypothetical protein